MNVMMMTVHTNREMMAYACGQVRCNIRCSACVKVTYYADMRGSSSWSPERVLLQYIVWYVNLTPRSRVPYMRQEGNAPHATCQ